MQNKKQTTEEFRLSGSELLAKVKELIKEGNARRLILKTEEGKTLLEIPLTAGVGVGALAVVLAPVLAAVGAIAALVARCTLVVERDAE